MQNKNSGHIFIRERRDIGQNQYNPNLHPTINKLRTASHLDTIFRLLIPSELNSTICLVDFNIGQEETYSLVFPEKADIQQSNLSILAPVGTVLLGHQAGDLIKWEVPAGKRRLR